MQRLCVAALVAGLASSAGFAQSPALTTDWITTTLSQEDCLGRAERVMRNAGLIRVERVGQSVFADTPDYQNQLAIRCFSEKQMAIFVGAGREGKASVTDGWTARLRTSFRDTP
jgi:hypothetical protein